MDRYDSRQGEFRAFWEQVAATDIGFSNDGARAAYRSPTDDTIWISKPDGSERRPITQSPLRAYQPHWSPDGRRIAFMGQAPGQPWRIYTVDAFGGEPHIEKPDDTLDQGVPSWSNDGKSLVFGERRGSRSDENMSIRVLDLNSGTEKALPESEGKWTPRWSPDGRYIVALGTDFRSLSLYDYRWRRWNTLATLTSIEDPAWSLDSRYVHFRAQPSGHTGRALFRVRVPDGAVEQLTPYLSSDITWTGVAPDGSPLVLNTTKVTEIYAIRFK